MTVVRSFKAWQGGSSLLPRPSQKGSTYPARRAVAMLIGRQIRLWALERHDLLKNYQWANHRQWIRLAGMNPFPKSAAEIERWYETTVGSNEVRIFAIKTPEGDYLGNIELRDIDLRSGKAELGIVLGEVEAQNRGIGSDAITCLARFAFRELRLQRIYARVLEHNARALHVFRKVGFQDEGIERQSHFAGGRHWNVVMLSLLAGELREEEESRASD